MSLLAIAAGFVELTVRDEDNPDGNIEIEFSGLRSAEKLYEELLTGSSVTGTEHPMVMRAVEHCIPWHQVQVLLRELTMIMDDFDCVAVRELLMQTVAEYQPKEGVQDLVWSRRRKIMHLLNVGAKGIVTDLGSRRAVTEFANQRAVCFFSALDEMWLPISI